MSNGLEQRLKYKVIREILRFKDSLISHEYRTGEDRLVNVVDYLGRPQGRYRTTTTLVITGRNKVQSPEKRSRQYFG